MQLAQQIKMRQSQSLVMTPQLQQAIKLLQMTNLELCQFLENQKLMSNTMKFVCLIRCFVDPNHGVTCCLSVSLSV